MRAAFLRRACPSEQLEYEAAKRAILRGGAVSDKPCPIAPAAPGRSCWPSTRGPPAPAPSFSTMTDRSAPWRKRNSSRSIRSRAGSSTTRTKSGRRNRGSSRRPWQRPRSRRRDHRRHRHHQPARNDRASGTARPASRSANAIVWQDRRTAPLLRRAARGRARGDFCAQDRPGDRRLLLRHQARMDARQRAGRARARRARRARLRHRRFVADLETDRRAGPRHRPVQRLPHDALQHPPRRLGRGAACSCSTCRAPCCPGS